MQLNTRQILYKKFRLEGYSKYTSARKAGYSHSYATQAKNIENRIDMAYWLEREGLTDAALAKHAKEGLESFRKRAEIVERDENGRPVYEYVNEPDNSARHKYFETILKLCDKLKDKSLVDQSKHYHITKVDVKISDDTNIPLTHKARLGAQEPGKV